MTDHSTNLTTASAVSLAFLTWILPNGPYRIETMVSEGGGPLHVETFSAADGDALLAFLDSENSKMRSRNIYFLPARLTLQAAGGQKRMSRPPSSYTSISTPKITPGQTLTS